MARKAISNDRYRLVGTYERLRKTLLEHPDDSRLDKALSYWVLPTDRRLPIAFLDRKLRDLLSQPFDDLMATPGVGQKKILGFFDLLKRASKASPPEMPFGLNGESANRPHKPAYSPNGFDSSVVSESLWASWCDTVHRFGMGPEKLGHLAPSLQGLPTVIWHTRLEEYVDRSLAEIRSLKTHGEKRVQAILEVFCAVHEALATATLQETIDVLLTPRFVPPLTRWILERAHDLELPPVEELHKNVVKPMINQIRIDLGDQVASLASARLSLDENAPSVKQQADALGVTRARVYQLLEDCARVMDVRWSEGRWLLAPLATRFGTSDPETIGLVHGIIDLFYPAEKSESSLAGDDRVGAGSS
jgi:hypothetical protein